MEKQIGYAGGGVAFVSGTILGLFLGQGWEMPEPLAIGILVVLAIAGSVFLWVMSRPVRLGLMAIHQSWSVRSPLYRPSTHVHVPATPTASPETAAANENLLPNVVLTACFSERMYLENDGRLVEHVDVAFAEFRNERAPDRTIASSAPGVVATLSYFAPDRVTQLLDRSIVGLWITSPIPERLGYGFPLLHWPPNQIASKVTLTHAASPVNIMLLRMGEDDTDYYAIDSKHFGKRTPSYKIGMPEIHIKVRLSNFTLDNDWWVVVKKEGQEENNADAKSLLNVSCG